MARTAREGRVDWIGLRPARRVDVIPVDCATLTADGLEGDHATSEKRAITLIQAEHLPVIAALANRTEVSPAMLRRNIVVSNLNLLGFRNARLEVGCAVIEVTGPCPPCSRMEEVFGPGGYTAMRGHGGVYARVVTPGIVSIGAPVRPVKS
ncbi:MAG: MOSC domain-containing protein [Pseudomonadota bacterium]